MIHEITVLFQGDWKKWQFSDAELVEAMMLAKFWETAGANVFWKQKDAE